MYGAQACRPSAKAYQKKDNTVVEGKCGSAYGERTRNCDSGYDHGERTRNCDRGYDYGEHTKNCDRGHNHGAVTEGTTKNPTKDTPQGKLTKPSGRGHDHAAVTTGTINNTSKANYVTLVSTHDWSGHLDQAYPQSIAKGKSGTFIHASNRGQIDEAAVVYADDRGCGWLLAWSVTDKPDGYNKVYVETGPIADYNNIDWAKIKVLLDVSMDTTYATDYKNETEAFANITTVGNRGALAATFNTTSK